LFPDATHKKADRKNPQIFLVGKQRNDFFVKETDLAVPAQMRSH